MGLILLACSVPYLLILLFMPSFAFLLPTLCGPLIAACVVAMARFWFAAFAVLLPSRPAPPLCLWLLESVLVHLLVF